MDKKGELLQMIYIFGTVLLVIGVVFMLTMSAPIVKETFGEFAEVARDIGVVSGTNTTVFTDAVLSPVENIIDNYSIWISVIYIGGIIFIFLLAFIFRGNVGPWNIVFFIMATILIVVICIIISNTYEEFYSDPGIIGDELQNAGILNYLILYSPTIMTIICFLAGIIMMTGTEANRYL